MRDASRNWRERANVVRDRAIGQRPYESEASRVPGRRRSDGIVPRRQDQVDPPLVSITVCAFVIADLEEHPELGVGNLDALKAFEDALEAEPHEANGVELALRRHAELRQRHDRALVEALWPVVLQHKFSLGPVNADV